MQNPKIINNILSEENSLISNNNNFNHKSPINLDINYLKQDILYFKNDVLKDLRQLEEKILIKLSEYKFENSKQNEGYETKIENISKKLSHINNIITDNINYSEKISSLESFREKTENNFFALNTKISLLQKETKDSQFKYEQIINENFLYPGIIGTNAKFQNFRDFIDYVLNNIKLLNEFKEEIINLDFNNYKKKIKEEIQCIKYDIDDNYKNSKNIIEYNIKEVNTKINYFVSNINDKFSENNVKIEDIENKMKQYFEENKEKITLIQNEFKDKYLEQFNQIENIKNIQKDLQIKNLQNEIYIKKRKSKNGIEIDKNIIEKKENKNIENKNNKSPILFKKLLFNNKKEIKPNPHDTIKLNPDNYENIKEKNINNSNFENNIKKQNILNSIKQDIEKFSNNIEVENIFENTEDNINNKYKKITKPLLSSKESLYNKITNSTKNNNNNIIDFDEMNIQKNIEDNYNHINHSFEFMNNNPIKSNKAINSIELKKKTKKLNFNSFQKISKKIFPNNYSITNIANINLKKIILPDPLNITNNYDYLSKTSSLSDNCFKTFKNSINMDQKSLLNDNKNNTKNMFKNLSGKNLNKITKKLKNNKFKSDSKEIKYDSLKIFPIKNKKYLVNDYNNIKKENNKNLSYENKSDKGSYLTSRTAQLESQKDKDKTKKIFTKQYEYLYDIKI